MADIDIRRTHHMAHASAKKAADTIADHLGRKFGLRGDWEGDTLNFQGTGVTGSLHVGPEELRITATLGFLLKAMKGSIESAVKRELDEILAKAPKSEPKAAAKPAAKAKAAKPATTKKAAPRAKKAR